MAERSTCCCTHCGLSFEYMHELRSHIREHIVEGWLLDNPPQRPTGDVVFYCHHCGFRSEAKSLLRAHMSKHLKTRQTHRFDCGTCGYRGATLEHLENHKMVHTDHKPFECHHCGHKTRRYHVLKSHIECHMGIKRFACKKCDYKSNYRFQLKNHQAARHGGKKKYKCQQCDYRTAYSGSLKSHETVHSGEKPFACGDCDYRCARKKDLRDHMAVHTGWKPYQCSFCDYRCSTPKYLKHHLRVHTGEKPFKCETCDFRTAHRAALRKHVDGHFGVFKFACQYCSYKTQYRTNWKHHVMLHEGDRPHNCPHCWQRFIAVNALNNHMRVHTGETPFQCRLCPSVFSSRKSWKDHLALCDPDHPALSAVRRQVVQFVPDEAIAMPSLVNAKPQSHEKSILDYLNKIQPVRDDSFKALHEDDRISSVPLKMENSAICKCDDLKTAQTHVNSRDNTRTTTTLKMAPQPPASKVARQATATNIQPPTTGKSPKATVEFIIDLPGPRFNQVDKPYSTRIAEPKKSPAVHKKLPNLSYQFFDNDTKIGEYSM